MLEDFFEGLVRTGVQAANSYLDAEIAFLQAEDLKTKEAARIKRDEEKMRLVRQKQNWDKFIQMKTYMSKEAVNQRAKEKDEADQAEKEKAEKERGDNVNKFTKHYGQHHEARSTYQKYPTDENWDVLEASASTMRQITATMGDTVDFDIDKDMEPLRTARDKKQTEKSEQETKKNQDRIDGVIAEYINDPENEELKSQALAALQEGVRLDADNPFYKNAMTHLFPDADAEAESANFDEATAAEPAAKERYDNALAAYQDDPTNKELSRELYEAGNELVDARKALGKDVSVIQDSIKDIDITSKPDEADEDTGDNPMSEADKIRAKERITANAMLSDEDKAKINSLIDSSPSVTHNDVKKYTADSVMKKVPTKSKDEREAEMLEAYPVRTENRSLMDRLVIDGRGVAARNVHEVLGGRGFEELSTEDKNYVADKVLADDEGASGAGEVEGRIRRSPLLIAERLAVLEVAMDKVKDKLDLSTAFVEGGLEKLGTADDADVREFATKAQRFMQDILRLDTGAQTNIFEMAQAKKSTPQLKNRPVLNDAIVDGLGGYVWGVVDQDFARRYTGEWGKFLPTRLKSNFYETAKSSAKKQDDEAAAGEQNAAMLASFEEDRDVFIVNTRSGIKQLIEDGTYDVQKAREVVRSALEAAGIPEVDAVLASVFAGMADEPEDDEE